MNHPGQENAERPDLSEKGRDAAGKPVSLDRRLFMQVLAFGGCRDMAPLVAALRDAKFPYALYADVNDPCGVGLATASEDPAFFPTMLRQFLCSSPFAALTLKPEYTMMGRSYSIGYENDLEHVLLRRPLQRMTNPQWPWVVWYPVRRSGAFEKLPPEEQRAILGEHGRIGALFGGAGHGQDIRLASFGLDRNDNDFLIGLVGANLYPLSAMVQSMRKTRQTSEYLVNLGPFFIGRAVAQGTGNVE